MKSHIIKEYLFKGFGIKFAHMLTNEDEIIKGISFIVHHKMLFSIAVSDVNWVDDNLEPYGFKLEDGILFILKTAISFK